MIKKRRLQRLTLQAHQVLSALQINSSIALTTEQRHYLCNVLRLEAESEFIALDRQGGWWLAKLSNDPDIAEVIAKLENNSELAAQITLGIAMPKGSNIESVIRQTTELGVRQIVPLFSDRTIIKSGTEIGNQKRDRWQRIAEEAAELSMRNYVPEINSPQTLAAWLDTLASSKSPTCKYICVTSHNAPHLLTSLQNSNGEENSEIIITTGSEGGWTAREEEMAIASGFIPVSLGDRVLSAITAPVVALSIVGAFLDTQ
ncbi:RsmE family RNA methyltransferase [Pseudanabaena minima]|uniref:RsmE family RNA methyltransferase n=1 Tax=Pseudanabaena minima TaxID=890415 RepID=UPI003DA990D5